MSKRSPVPGETPQLSEVEELRRLMDDLARSKDIHTWPPTETSYNHWALSDQEGALWSWFNERAQEILEMFERKEEEK